MDSDPGPLFGQLAISLLLGLLVGLQRERTEAALAGFRTFPLITVLGTVCAILGETFGYGWALGAGFAGIVAVILVGNLHKLRQERADPGVTTEVAMLLMFAVGALVAVGPTIFAVAVAGAVVILLQLKPELHGFARRLGDEDVKAILQFVLITFIVLPVLHEYNRDYDPLDPLRPFIPALEGTELDVLNPYEIWLMVVLVVSISLGGYVAYKLLGRRSGTLLGGILGGTISSTAATVSYARRSAETERSAGAAAVVIIVAATVVYLRVLVEIAVTAPRFLRTAGGPLLVMFAVSAALAAAAWLTQSREHGEMPHQENPAELKWALIFGLLYATVIVLVAIGRTFLRDEWLFAIAGLSGMVNMDAITLSTSNLVRSGRIDEALGWRVIIVAAMSNLAFKGALVAALGDRALLRRTVLLFGLSIVAGGVLLAVW